VSATPWINASRSNDRHSCVEMRTAAGVIEVRDSKDRSGPVLRFTRAEFAAWLDGARAGEFDHLLITG
jgi:putative SOS response-associated peptidase YedK